jgi:CheY-like chemotaxis protein
VDSEPQQNATLLDVLIVDDDPDFRWLTRDALSTGDPPCRMHEAASADEALVRLNCDPELPEWIRPNLILLDVEMPGMSGLAMVSILKQDPALRDIAVVLITGGAAEVIARYASHLGGADRVIQKAQDVQEMGRLLRDIVREYAKSLPPRKNDKTKKEEEEAA